jgi:para-nitrobenzyl esterase
MIMERRMRISATSWRLRGRLAAGVAAAALVAGSTLAAMAPAGASAAPAAAGSVVATHFGPVRGKTVSGISEFLGIPYAAPPTGRLRWHAPEPPARWRGVRAATAFGAHCPQSAGPFGSASNTSENCLFLNVFTKAGRNPAGRPVMVWIHGGALVTGESDAFNPTSLVNDGVTVVTINYRLGALGFLADSALADRAGHSGNYGLMDQQAALLWVKANIARFGGDARDVTLFGESAGGLSTLSQIDSRRAAGLFQRAIVESGSYNLTQAPLATAEAAGAAFAAKVGCGTQASAAATAACLRAVPVATLVASQNAGGYTPDLDGRVLQQSIGTALQKGQFNRVPVIMGTNHDEWRLFVALAQLAGAPAVTAANYQAQIQATLGVPAAVAARIAAQYPVASFPSPPLALGALGTDAIFACPSLEAVSFLSAFTPTFSYEFNDENAPSLFLPSVGFPLGAAHGSELQYLFDPFPPATSQLSPAQQVLSAQMKAYWTSLAKHGSPQTAGQPAWPLFNAVTQPMLSLDEPRPAVETSFAAEHQCAFWAGLAAASTN